MKSAIVLVSGLGQYELHLNGASVTDTVLNPGWTNYRTTVLYNTFDVTQRLHPGENAFGVLLGDGMYNTPASPKGEVLLGSGRYEFRFQVR